MQATVLAHVMTEEVRTVDAGAPFASVVSQMADARLSCVVVVERDRPTGIFTERDLARILRSLLAGQATPGTIADVMASPVQSAGAWVDVESAHQQMRQTGIRRLVVVDEGGTLVGIVTQSDLLEGLRASLERERDLLEQRVRDRTTELEHANERLQRLALVDGLLEIGNRRAMEVELDRFGEAFQRHGRRYGIVLLDVDQFKTYNDRYGHPLGDQVLRSVARVLRGSIRATDQVFRYGGEELLVLLSEPKEPFMAVVSERMRAGVEMLGIEHADSPGGVVTASFGYATCQPRETWTEVVKRADAALYRAKANGRNRCEPGDVEPAS